MKRRFEIEIAHIFVIIQIQIHTINIRLLKYTSILSIAPNPSCKMAIYLILLFYYLVHFREVFSFCRGNLKEFVKEGENEDVDINPLQLIVINSANNMSRCFPFGEIVYVSKNDIFHCYSLNNFTCRLTVSVLGRKATNVSDGYDYLPLAKLVQLQLHPDDGLFVNRIELQVHITSHNISKAIKIHSLVVYNSEAAPPKVAHLSNNEMRNLSYSSKFIIQEYDIITCVPKLPDGVYEIVDSLTEAVHPVPVPYKNLLTYFNWTKIGPHRFKCRYKLPKTWKTMFSATTAIYGNTFVSEGNTSKLSVKFTSTGKFFNDYYEMKDNTGCSVKYFNSFTSEIISAVIFLSQARFQGLKFFSQKVKAKKHFSTTLHMEIRPFFGIGTKHLVCCAGHYPMSIISKALFNSKNLSKEYEIQCKQKNIIIINNDDCGIDVHRRFISPRIKPITDIVLSGTVITCESLTCGNWKYHTYYLLEMYKVFRIISTKISKVHRLIIPWNITEKTSLIVHCKLTENDGTQLTSYTRFKYSDIFSPPHAININASSQIIKNSLVVKCVASGFPRPRIFWKIPLRIPDGLLLSNPEENTLVFKNNNKGSATKFFTLKCYAHTIIFNVHFFMVRNFTFYLESKKSQYKIFEKFLFIFIICNVICIIYVLFKAHLLRLLADMKQRCLQKFQDYFVK